MGEVTLLYGIGAPKAGTSWLYEYLQGHPQCHLRAIKETHYFDALAHNNFDDRVDFLRKKAARLRSAGLGREAQDAEDLEAVFAGKADDRHSAYVDYMTGGADSGIRAVADITPGYANMGQRWLAEMANVVLPSRFLYILRDPVDRLWSHLKMIAERAIGQTDDYAVIVDQYLDHFIAGSRRPLTRRSDYRGNIDRLLAVVPRGQVMITFFERLFRQDTVDAICRFAGLDSHPGRFASRVMVGADLAITEDQWQRAARALAPQYAFAREFFEDDLPQSWRASMDRMEAHGRL